MQAAIHTGRVKSFLKHVAEMQPEKNEAYGVQQHDTAKAMQPPAVSSLENTMANVLRTGQQMLQSQSYEARLNTGLQQKILALERDIMQLAQREKELAERLQKKDVLNSQALSELRQSIERMADKITDARIPQQLKPFFDELNSKLAALNTPTPHLEDIRSQIGKLKDGVADAQGAADFPVLNKILGNLDELNAKLDSIEQKREERDRKIESMEKSLEKAFSISKVSDIDDRLRAMEQKLDSMKGQYSDEHISMIRQKVEGLKNRTQMTKESFSLQEQPAEKKEQLPEPPLPPEDIFTDKGLEFATKDFGLGNKGEISLPPAVEKHESGLLKRLFSKK